MSDENERSVASAGSVAGEPVAWAVVWENDERFDRYTVSFTEEAARRRAASCPSMKSNIVTLYRSPALTDDEREAIAYFAAIDGPQYLADANEAATTLRFLLERTK